MPAFTKYTWLYIFLPIRPGIIWTDRHLKLLPIEKMIRFVLYVHFPFWLTNVAKQHLWVPVVTWIWGECGAVKQWEMTSLFCVHCLPANRAFQNRKSGWSTRSFFWFGKRSMTYGWNGKIRCKLKFAALILFVIFISLIRETAPQRPLISLRTCIYIFTCTPQKLSETMQLCLRASVVLFIAVNRGQAYFSSLLGVNVHALRVTSQTSVFTWVHNTNTEKLNLY